MVEEILIIWYTINKLKVLEVIMAKIKPFMAVRPDEKVAEKVAALPYDVYNRQEAKEAVKDNPLSFLRIDRA